MTASAAEDFENGTDFSKMGLILGAAYICLRVLQFVLLEIQKPLITRLFEKLDNSSVDCQDSFFEKWGDVRYLKCRRKSLMNSK